MPEQTRDEQASFTAVTDNAERLKWYQEVLSLDPDSRIFLPYARLVAQSGNIADSIGILKKGLVKHPEFLEAKLELLDLLERSGQGSAAMAESSELIGQLSAHASLWEIWSRMPGVRADMAAMLIFFASCMKNEGFSLADVLSAGLRGLRAGEGTSRPVPHDQAAVSPDATVIENQREEELLPWRSLDEVPDDDDLPDTALKSPTPLTLQHGTEEVRASGGGISLPGPIPPSETEGKCSLFTRSMAAVLEEQGALEEAAEIYRELIKQARSDEERNELNAKLESLMHSIPDTEGQQARASVIGMLEELAVRLEQRAKG